MKYVQRLIILHLSKDVVSITRSDDDNSISSMQALADATRFRYPGRSQQGQPPQLVEPSHNLVVDPLLVCLL